MFFFAQRNGLEPPYTTVEAARAAYRFNDLQSFLDLYYKGMNVLRTEADFADLADAYFQKAKAQGVVHAEIFFDPQAHLGRGLTFETFFDGLWSTVSRSEERYGITSALDHVSSARSRGRIGAARADRGAAACREDSSPSASTRRKSVIHPRSTPRFSSARVLRGGAASRMRAKKGRRHTSARRSTCLHVERIDHGVRALEDPALVARLRAQRIPLTVCPFSNVKLRVVPNLHAHPMAKMLAEGLFVTCNSDDPAYFGGYVADNLRGVCGALDLPPQAAVTLARNSFEAAFLSQQQKATICICSKHR